VAVFKNPPFWLDNEVLNNLSSLTSFSSLNLANLSSLSFASILLTNVLDDLTLPSVLFVDFDYLE
jgi:hypothetical protein